MKVSLADVEVLRQAEAELSSFMSLLESCCAAELQQMEDIGESINKQITDLSAEQEEAEENLQHAQEAYAAAVTDYNQAAANLSRAQSRTASSNSGDGKDDSADDEVEEAKDALDEAAEKLDEAETSLEEAIAQLNTIKEKLTAALAWEEAWNQKKADMQNRHEALPEARSAAERGREILKRKFAAMEAYLNEPAVRMAHNWLFSLPGRGGLVTPQQLNARLNPPPAVRLEVARYLRDSTPSFGRVIDNLAQRVHSAATPQERWSAMRQIRTTVTGALAELMAQRGLECYANRTETQSRTYFEGGQYTKTDLIMKDLKSPVILGKGPGMMAPAGGSIALEVKCGCKEYLMQQLQHMVFQAGGHQHCDASFTLTTRDIMQLPPEKQQQLREALREAGSPIVGMLPEKAEMDTTCMQLVEERVEALYGKDSNQAG